MHLDKTAQVPIACKHTAAGARPAARRLAALAGPVSARNRRGVFRFTAFLVAVAVVFVTGAHQALANDLSTDPCTAGDVEIVGSGIVINEPCACAPGVCRGAGDATCRFSCVGMVRLRAPALAMGDHGGGSGLTRLSSSKQGSVRGVSKVSSRRAIFTARPYRARRA